VVLLSVCSRMGCANTLKSSSADTNTPPSCAIRCSAERGYVTGTEPRSTGSEGMADVSMLYGIGMMGGEVEPAGKAAVVAVVELVELIVAVVSLEAEVEEVEGAGMLSGCMGMWRRAATGPFC